MEKVTQSVTVIILCAYIALVAFFTWAANVSSANPTGEHYKNFFELTKTGFTTLGSALTLILGYYFGQKAEEKKKDIEVQTAKAKEAKLATELKTVTEEKTTAEADKADLLSKLKTTAVQSQPETVTEVDRAQRPAGRPLKDDSVV